MSNRINVQLAAGWDEGVIKKWIKQYEFVITQPKLNGGRGYWNGEQFLTSEGNEIKMLPVIQAALSMKFKGFRIDGEVYHHGWSRQRIHGIMSRKVNLHTDHDKVFFHVFDHPDHQMSQVQRLSTLSSLLFIRKPILPLVQVLSTRCYSYDQVWSMYKRYLQEGYEGIIVRNPASMYKDGRTADMRKLKPDKFLKAVVKALHEGTGKYAGTLGALTVEWNGNEFNVGSFKVDDVERDKLWRGKLSVGDMVKVSYIELTDKGVPPSSVYIKEVK